MRVAWLETVNESADKILQRGRLVCDHDERTTNAL